MIRVPNVFRRVPVAILFAAVLAAAIPASSVAEMDAREIRTLTLENGMEVFLWEDHTIPNLAMYTFWKVGSRNEAPGITGLAHFFEHMMFLGSRNYPPGEFDRVMEAAGGANNAYTSNDVTVYQNWVPASSLELTLEQEADRIGWLSVDPEVVESERGVVTSERRRSVEDDNHSLMWEQLQSAAFMAHPYSWPVIGWASDIASWRQEDVEQFFKDWYTPNNAVLVIVGAFDIDTAIPLIKKTIGAVPSHEIPRGVVTTEPPQNGERRVILRKEANSGSVLVGWHVPNASHPDLRVLELIDVLLTTGESSRLYRRLVDQDEVALWAWSGTDDNFDPGLFQVLVQSREGIDGTAVEQSLYDEIDRLAVDPVTHEELEKAKNVLLANFYREMATISGRAHALGKHEVFQGDYKKLFQVATTYESITAEDISRVVREYFLADNRTTVTLIPVESEEADHEN